MVENKIFIGVIGAGDCSEDVYKLAEQVGERIAKAGAVLVCGGLSGVMEATSKGAKKEGGTTIGILPGIDKGHANSYIDFPIVTGLGEARNLLVIRNSDVVIALPGEYGTLSEIGFSLKLEKPIIGLFTWDVSEAIIKAKNAEEAVKIALSRVSKYDG
ncbi:MAG: TIGR00725 family protein [candidate division Zixibacteria bacterium]|nr:TIGR00725 family protein [candidate division Zixibacteria bacterium]